MPKPTNLIRELIAVLGVAFYIAAGAWFAFVSVPWFSDERRWFVVGLTLSMYGYALRHLGISPTLIRVRRRLGLPKARIIRLECALQLAAGLSLFVGAVTFLIRSNTAEHRVLGVLGAVGALAWVLLYGWLLRTVRGFFDDQPEVTDTP